MLSFAPIRAPRGLARLAAGGASAIHVRGADVSRHGRIRPRRAIPSAARQDLRGAAFGMARLRAAAAVHRARLGRRSGCALALGARVLGQGEGGALGDNLARAQPARRARSRRDPVRLGAPRLQLRQRIYGSRGGQEFGRLPLSAAIMRRFGQTGHYAGHPDLEWDNFIRRQLYRVGVASAPYSLVRTAGYDFPTDENTDLPLAPTVLGAAAAVAALGASALARRRRVLTATAVMFGFCWAIPMRHYTFWANRVYESLPYIFLTLALFTSALLGARRLLGERIGERLAFAVCAAAAGVFAMSVFHAGRLDRDAAEAERDKSLTADFSAIGAMTRGKRVIAFPRHFYTTLDYVRKNHYLAGSYWSVSEEVCAPRAADFVISRYRRESLNLLAPENRFAFLYEDAAPLDLRRAERRNLESSDPAARAAFDVYLQDGAGGFRPVSEPRPRHAVIPKSALRRERRARTLLPKRPPGECRRPARRPPRGRTRKPKLRLRAAVRGRIQRQVHGDAPPSWLRHCEDRNGPMGAGRRTGVGRGGGCWSLGRVDTRNLTQGREDAIIALVFPIFTPPFPRKRGILTVAAKPATRNQV